MESYPCNGESNERDKGIISGLILMLIRGYRMILSPLLPPSCIYTPTCSRYTETAINRFGALKGGWLSLLRVLRCNPFRKGGYDPVPEKWENRK